MKFKQVLKELYFELMDLKEEWITITKIPNKKLFAYYIRSIIMSLSPICPH